MPPSKHTTNSRDSGVFFDLDFDLDVSENANVNENVGENVSANESVSENVSVNETVSEKVNTPYSNYLGLHIPVTKSICEELDYDPFFSIYPLDVVLPPKLPLDAKVPFSYYLGLGSQKTTKRGHSEHENPQ
ncbi:13189_t:CDS:1, partial [Racocetra fulgida]